MKRTVRVMMIVLVVASILAAYAALVVNTGEWTSGPRFGTAQPSGFNATAADALAMYREALDPTPPATQRAATSRLREGIPRSSRAALQRDRRRAAFGRGQGP